MIEYYSVEGWYCPNCMKLCCTKGYTKVEAPYSVPRCGDCNTELEYWDKDGKK